MRERASLPPSWVPLLGVAAAILGAELMFAAGVRIPALIYLPVFVALIYVGIRGTMPAIVAGCALVVADVVTLDLRMPVGVPGESTERAIWQIVSIAWVTVPVGLIAWSRRRADAAVENAARLNRELNLANADLKAFTHVATHDLKEPVRGIVSILRAIDEDHAASLTPQVAEDIAAARRSADQLETLLVELLAISAAGRLAASDLTECDVARVVERPECRARFEAIAAARHATVQVAQPIPTLLGSPALLAQVIGNLALNGIRHNPRPEPHVVIRESAQPARPGFVHVEVADDGNGFPDAVLRGGVTGGKFGLDIARQTIARLGGRMWLANAPDGGGVVHIELPAPQRAAPRRRLVARAS